MLTIELKVIIISWAHTPISFEHMYVILVSILRAHKATYYSNIGVLIRTITEKELSMAFFTHVKAFALYYE